MNYSTYFENKVAANLSNRFNLIVLGTDPVTQKDFIKSTTMVSSSEEAFSQLDKLDPYQVQIAERVITAKVMNYGKETVQ